FFHADRSVADAEIGEPHIGETLAVGARAGGQSDDRIVAVAACELGKANARILVSHRDTNGGYDFVRSQRSLKQAFEESVGLHFALTLFAGDVDLSPPRPQAGRPLRGPLRKCDGAAKATPVSDGGMPDMRYGECNQRGVARDNVGPLKLRMTCKRTDFDKFALLGDAVEPFDAIDVDQQGRRRKPHVEGCDQTLP